MSSGYTESATEAWRARVERHHAQSEGVMDESLRQGDFWRNLAPMFRADPYREDDAILNVLLGMVSEDMTVLDVGGGAGRFAIPLALRCREATVVDPSPSMLAQLDEAAAEVEGVKVNGVHSEWESAEIGSADLVLCSHVVYGVADVRPFVQKLQDHARREGGLGVVRGLAAGGGCAAVGTGVRGGRESILPALPELMNALWEMGIYPNVRMLAPTGPQSFESVEAAVEEVGGRLFIGSDTGRRRRLAESIEGYLEAVESGYRIREARQVRQGVVWWDVQG